MRVGIATDHGGFSLKEDLLPRLRAAGHEMIDFGADALNEGDDYPDFVTPLARAVAAGTVERGIGVCGSGVGASICANKIRGVRAALVEDHFSARQGVEDDHMNIICMGAMTAASWIFLAGGPILLPQFVFAQTSGKSFTTDAMQIEPVKSNEVAMSPEFRVAIYENLVEEVTKAGELQHVYRSGDRRASDERNLLTMHITVEGFKRGSEKEREVTTVAGWTIIKADVQLVARDGRILMDRQVKGKVRLFGGNLKATHDLAKKVSKLIREAPGRGAVNTPGT